jgi:hypothetical protein
MPIKIGGREVPTALNEDFIVLTRGEESIVIRARALPDMDEFLDAVTEPKPPGKLVKGDWKDNLDDPTYKQRMEMFARQRAGFLVIHSLKPSDIEWETVDIDDPKTWPNWEDDLKNSGFTNVECNHILQLVMDVNQLDEAKMKAARESFLRGQVAASEESLGPTTGQSDS